MKKPEEKLPDIPPVSLWKNPCLSSKYLFFMLVEVLGSVLRFIQRRFIILASLTAALLSYLYAPGPHIEVFTYSLTLVP